MSEKGPDIFDALKGSNKIAVFEYQVIDKELLILKSSPAFYSPNSKPVFSNYAEWKNHIHPDDVDKFDAAIGSYIENPTAPFDIILKYNHPEKGVIQVCVNLSVIKTGINKRPIKLLGLHYKLNTPEEDKGATIKEEQFKVIFDAVENIIISTDKQGKINLMNPVAEFVIGWKLSEVAGKDVESVLTLIDANSKKRIPCLIKELETNKNDIEEKSNLLLVDRFGVELYVDCSASPIKKGEQEEIIGYVISIRDITQEHITRENLRVYKRLIDSSTQGFLMFSLSGTIKYMNTALVKMLESANARQYYARIFMDVFSTTSKQLIKRNVHKLHQIGSWKAEMELCTKDSKIVQVNVSFFRLKDINNVNFLYGAIITDITEQKRQNALIKEYDELLEKIIDNLPLSIYIKEPVDLNIMKINKGFTKILGLTPMQVLNKNDFDLFNKEEAENYAKADRDVIENDKYIEVPEEIVNTENGERILHTIKMPLHDSKGNVKYLLGIGEDITERKKAEQIVIDSERRFRNLFENAPIAYLATDNEGVIIDFNPELTKLTGYNTDELIGCHYSSLVQEIDLQWFHEMYKELITTGEISMECSILTKSGNKRDLIAISKAQYNQKGGIERLHGILIDFTERKKIEENLKIAKEAAESANKAKSAFLANMSHEIRTPMNAIIGFSEILLQQTVEDSQKGYLNSIMSSGKTLLALINDILDLSKIEAGKISLKKDIVSIKQIFNELKQVFTVNAQQKGLNLVIKVENSVPEYIEIDELRIRQVLINLMNNAIKFTHKGYIKVNAQAENLGKRCNLVLSVEDTGIGIKKSDQDRIFEAFNQTDHYDSRKFEGTGLGLAITSRIVGLFKGQINLKSKPAEGSTFTITLPNITIHTSVVVKEVSEDIDLQRVVFSKGKILIVDDKESNLNVAKGLLKQYNLDLLFADNGAKAFEIALAELPDLIFMDLRMPEMDGYKATKFIKSNEKTRQIPVVALTASVLGFNDKLLEDRNFSGYLPKPVEYKKLVIELCKFLPYELTPEKSKVDKSKNEIISIKENKELIDYLRKNVLGVWEKLKTVRTSKLEKEFALLLTIAGENFDNEYLETMGKSMEQALESFDIEKIEALRSEFYLLFSEFKDN